MNTDIVVNALKKNVGPAGADNTAYQNKARDIASRLLIPREIAFCPGCPHRASFYAIKTALTLDGRNGFVVGDIGCYGLAAGATGFNQIKALHCMGSGSGNVSGFSKMASFGFEQPVVAVMGDSTFYHASLPALVNAKHNNAKALFIILDNAVTAMTGFQENPATPSETHCRGHRKSPSRRSPQVWTSKPKSLIQSPTSTSPSGRSMTFYKRITLRPSFSEEFALLMK